MCIRDRYLGQQDDGLIKMFLVTLSEYQPPVILVIAWVDSVVKTVLTIEQFKSMTRREIPEEKLQKSLNKYLNRRKKAEQI